MSNDNDTKPITARAVIDDIFAQLATALTPDPNRTTVENNEDGRPNKNVLEGASPAAKALLLTLHVLYPNELLPALDLLDRRLLMRFVVRDEQDQANAGLRDQEDPATYGNNGDQADLQLRARDPEHRMNPISKDSNEEIPVQHKSASPQPQGLLHQHQEQEQQQQQSSRSPPPPIYFVRSAQQPNTRLNSYGGRFYDPLALSTHYEVRLHAWNCSCPAFCFAAFPALSSFDGEEDHQEEGAGVIGEWQDIRSVLGDALKGVRVIERGGEGGGFGGVMLIRPGEGMRLPPVCKHLLACFFVETVLSRGGHGDDLQASSYVETKVVSAEESAGWAAGWGD